MNRIADDALYLVSDRNSVHILHRSTFRHQAHDVSVTVRKEAQRVIVDADKSNDFANITFVAADADNFNIRFFDTLALVADSSTNSIGVLTLELISFFEHGAVDGICRIVQSFSLFGVQSVSVNG